MGCVVVGLILAGGEIDDATSATALEAVPGVIGLASAAGLGAAPSAGHAQRDERTRGLAHRVDCRVWHRPDGPKRPDGGFAVPA